MKKILDFITNISGLFNKLLEVFIGERRKRVRDKLDKLKIIRKDLLMQKPSLKRSIRLRKIERKINELENYLINK